MNIKEIKVAPEDLADFKAVQAELAAEEAAAKKPPALYVVISGLGMACWLENGALCSCPIGDDGLPDWDGGDAGDEWDFEWSDADAKIKECLEALTAVRM